MFIGAQLAHLGERTRQACQRAGAAFGFGASCRVDMMAADDHLDLRQFALDGAGDALDQRDAGGIGRIVQTIHGGAPANHLPFIDFSACDFVGRIDRDRLGAHHHVGGSFCFPARLDRGRPLGGQLLLEGSGRFRLCGFPDGAIYRRLFRR
jgi:hypothetical protein